MHWEVGTKRFVHKSRSLYFPRVIEFLEKKSFEAEEVAFFEMDDSIPHKTVIRRMSSIQIL